MSNVINCYKQMTEKMDEARAQLEIRYSELERNHSLYTDYRYSLLDVYSFEVSNFPYLEYLKYEKIVEEIKAYEQLRFVKLCKSGFFDNLLQAKHFKKCVDKSFKYARKYLLKREREQKRNEKKQEKIKKFVEENYSNISSED